MLFETCVERKRASMFEFQGVIIPRVWVSSVLYLPEILDHTDFDIDMQLLWSFTLLGHPSELIILHSPSTIDRFYNIPLHVFYDYVRQDLKPCEWLVTYPQNIQFCDTLGCADLH